MAAAAKLVDGSRKNIDQFHIGKWMLDFKKRFNTNTIFYYSLSASKIGTSIVYERHIAIISVHKRIFASLKTCYPQTRSLCVQYTCIRAIHYIDYKIISLDSDFSWNSNRNDNSINYNVSMVSLYLCSDLKKVLYFGRNVCYITSCCGGSPWCYWVYLYSCNVFLQSCILISNLHIQTYLVLLR